MSLTKEQFYARHSSSAKWLALDAKQKKQRWKSYLAGTSDKSVVPSKKGLVLAGKPSQGKQKGKAAAQAAAVRGGYKLSPRTHDFLTARYNPFCPRVTNVGYPSTVVGGSIKVRGFARGSMVCNAAGYGFIMVSPGFGAGAANCVSFSSASTYAGAADAFPTGASPIGSSSVPLSGMPFPYSGTGALTTMTRIVAGGIRVRNTTPLLTKGGSCKTVNYPIMDDMFSLTGAQMLGPFAKYSGWHDLADANCPWMSAIWSPVATPDLGVVLGTGFASKVDGGWFNLQALGSFNNEYSVGILMSGAPNASFDFEVVFFYEFFGPPSLADVNSLVNTMMTPSYPDPLGQSITTASLVNTPNAQAKTTDGGVTLDGVLDIIGQAGRAVLGSSTATDFLSSVMPNINSGSGVDLTQPVADSSLQGWASDSSSGVLADLESRFFALAGREAGSALPEIAAAMAI